MSRIKKIEGEIVEARNQLIAIDEACDNESRARTEEEKAKYKELRGKIESLNVELQDAKDADEQRKIKEEYEKEQRKIAAAAAGAAPSRSEERELDKVNKSYSLRDAFKHIIRGTKPTEGLVAEMHQEAETESRAFSTSIIGVGIPAKMVSTEQRATVDQTNSTIQPVQVGGYVDALRENSVAMKVGVDVIEDLTADYKIPAVGSQSVAWATAENSAAADGGAQFTSLTLNPTRLTAYVDISNRILLQNGDAPLRSVMRDLGRATSEKIDAAMFSTASVTNAPAAIAATSGVGTFTEVATWVATTTVIKDFIKAEQTLLANKGGGPRNAYVASTELLWDLKQAPQVSSVIPASTSNTYGYSLVNGYPCYFTVAATKSAGTSGDALFGDWSQVKLGFFGGLDLIRDPYSALLNDETRVVLHRHLDFGTTRGAAFVKFTSLVA